MASDTSITPNAVADVMDMLERRYSGEITPRDLDVAKIAYAAAYATATADERNAIIRLASEMRATVPADHPKGAQASFADYLRVTRGGTDGQ